MLFKGEIDQDDCPPIAVILATDRDYGENATITYDIVSGPSIEYRRFFTIDDKGRIFSTVSKHPIKSIH